MKTQSPTTVATQFKAELWTIASGPGETREVWATIMLNGPDKDWPCAFGPKDKMERLRKATECERKKNVNVEPPKVSNVIASQRDALSTRRRRQVEKARAAAYRANGVEPWIKQAKENKWHTNYLRP